MTAALVPLGGATATLLHFPTPLSESIVVALIAGALLRAAIRPLHVPGRILGLPLLLAVTVCGSYVVQLAVRRAAVGPDQFSQELMHLLSGGYLASTVVSAQLKAAAVFLEGLALFCISAVIVQNDRTRLSRFVWVMVVGATGAAALNVLRLASAALAAVSHGRPWSAWRAPCASTSVRRCQCGRLVFRDAGLPCGGPGASLAPLAETRMGGVLCPAGRGTLVDELPCGGAGTLRGRSRRHRFRRPCVEPPHQPTRPGNRSRDPLCRSTLDLLVPAEPAARPGHPSQWLSGATWPSSRYGSRRSIPCSVSGLDGSSTRPDRRCNGCPWPLVLSGKPHNTFLQVLGELGLVGLFGFVGIVWQVSASAWTCIRSSPSDRYLVFGLAGGVCVFLVSGLVGHPLLTPECAYAFWMVMGSLIGYCVGRTASSTPRRAVLGAAVTALLISVPFRGAAAVRGADLENIGYGVSLWQTAPDGVKYRVASSAGTIYVAGDRASADIPLRTSGPSDSVSMVTLTVAGRMSDRIPVTGGGWTRYRLVIPSNSRALYIPVTFTLEDPAGVSLYIGKPVFPGPRRDR